MNKKLITILLFSVLLTASYSLGDTVNNEGYNFSYAFHLYYDNGKLSIDKDVKFAYDPIPEAFVQETIAAPKAYRGEVINLLGKTAGTFQFDPRMGNTAFKNGKITVRAPFFADGKEVNFYDNDNKKLLTVSVAASSFCNDDNVCNKDIGEDNNNCPNDCKADLPPSPIPSYPPGTEEKPGIFGSPILIYVLIGVGIVSAAFVLWRLFKNKNIIK